MNLLISKLANRGADALTDRELLTLLLDDETLADALIEECHGALGKLADKETPRLRMVGGMGLRRAVVLEAALELGRRVAVEKTKQTNVINGTQDIVRIFKPQLAGLSHEECWTLFLTSSNRIIDRMRVSQGGVQATVVDHRLIIKRALELLAAQIVLVHNHPSGAALASRQDITMTERVRQAADLFDIRLLDHIIISREGDYSFRREGLLK